MKYKKTRVLRRNFNVLSITEPIEILYMMVKILIKKQLKKQSDKEQQEREKKLPNNQTINPPAFNSAKLT
jgi:hypothetical protein